MPWYGDAMIPKRENYPSVPENVWYCPLDIDFAFTMNTGSYNVIKKGTNILYLPMI